MRSAWLLVCVALSLALVGCGLGGPQYETVTLEGQVTVAGQPVSEGRINFTPQRSGLGPGTGADIKDGRYVAPDVPVGKMLVQFNASRLTGKTVVVMGSEMAERINLVPEPLRGGIEIDVSADGSQRNFDLAELAARPSGSQP